MCFLNLLPPPSAVACEEPSSHQDFIAGISLRIPCYYAPALFFFLYYTVPESLHTSLIKAKKNLSAKSKETNDINEKDQVNKTWCCITFKSNYRRFI